MPVDDLIEVIPRVQDSADNQSSRRTKLSSFDYPTKI